MNLEKVLNILFYNFRLVDYGYRKLLLIYLNPFCWISNFGKLKFGFKMFMGHMEKNFPSFLNLYRNDNFSKLFFLIAFILINCFIINLILLVFGISLAKSYFTILLVSVLISILLSFIFLFQDEKFYKYHKEFYTSKKFNYPLVTLFSIVIIFCMWIGSFLY